MENKEKCFNITFEEVDYNFKFTKEDDIEKWNRYCYKENELTPFEYLPRGLLPKVWDFQEKNKIIKVEDILMEKEYLIWVNFGGEQGSPICEQDYYKICKGRTEEEAVIDWFKQNDFDLKNMKKFGDTWTDFGRPLTTIRLIKSNGYEGWKTLKWMEKEDC